MKEGHERGGPGPGPEEPPRAVCIPGPGEKIVQDFQMLVQKVGGRPEVLLVGETLEGKDIHGMMASFVKDLFSATCHPVQPGEALKAPCSAACSVGGRPCQLIFFLCRASSVKGKQRELCQVLKEVKQLVQKAPCALVGIIMEPTKGEAEAARAQLLRLLRNVFPKAPKQSELAAGSGHQGKEGPVELEEVQVEAEVYIPGHPRGNLAIMKAACRASGALTSRGPSRALALLKGLAGMACVAGLASVAGWYMYERGLISPDVIPVGLLSFV
ncbi:hypothetical protein EYD10_16250 [Varanus komodoensis]|nr:hypothetical protein EYD10_16250 [Varanus komodoensis]